MPESDVLYCADCLDSMQNQEEAEEFRLSDCIDIIEQVLSEQECALPAVKLGYFLCLSINIYMLSN